jgi:hypothetical protein
MWNSFFSFIVFGTQVKHLQLCDKENKQEGKSNSSTKDLKSN